MMRHLNNDPEIRRELPKTKKTIWIFLTMGVLLITGCLESRYHLLFPKVDGLKTGAPLLFENNEIGQVKKIEYTPQGAYQVSVVVDDAFTAAMTEFSRFEILPVSREGSMEGSTSGENKAIVMIHEEKGGKLLEKGSTFQALSPKESGPLDKVSPVLKQLEEGWDHFIDGLKNIPESESYNAFEKKIDELGRQMKESGSAFQDNVRDNIIPKLKKELEELRKKFEQGGEPEKTKPLEKKLENLQDV